MRLVALLEALIGCSQAAAAPVECANIDIDLDRLACYDREVGRIPKITALPGKGAWVVRSEKSVLTDRIEVFMSVRSDENVVCGWNKGARVNLTLRCMDNTTALIFDTGCHMTSSEYNSHGDVTYRIDAEKARSVSMVESTDNRSLGLWSGGKAIPMIKQMLGKSRVVARMTPYGENPITATFPVSGLEDAIKPLRQACDW